MRKLCIGMAVSCVIVIMFSLSLIRHNVLLLGATCASSVVTTLNSSDTSAATTCSIRSESDTRSILLSTTSTAYCRNSVETNLISLMKLPVSNNTRSSKESVSTISSVSVPKSESTSSAIPLLSIEVCDGGILSTICSIGESAVKTIPFASVEVSTEGTVMSDSSLPTVLDSPITIQSGSSHNSDNDVWIVNHVEPISPSNESEIEFLSSNSDDSGQSHYDSCRRASMETFVDERVEQVSTPLTKCEEDPSADSSRYIVIDDGDMGASSLDGSSSLCRADDKGTSSLGKRCSGTSLSDLLSDAGESVDFFQCCLSVE